MVIAANAGAVAHPDWYYNLMATSQVTIEVGNERFTAQTSIAQGAERERLVAMVHYYAAQQIKTSRVIPVVIFTKTVSD